MDSPDPAETPVSEPSPLQVLTFLIADVRGYTRFTEDHGDRAAAQLATRFAGLAREAVSGGGGRVIELRGDEALAVFQSCQQALAAAVALQERCDEAIRLDPSLPLRIGVGIDAGEGVPVEDGYRGLALNVAARLCSLAGPGEIYATHRLIDRAQRVEHLAYVERGSVQLKGIAEPVRVVQVLAEDKLPENFSPLVSLVGRPSNLPLQATPFIGRGREVREITGLLQREEVRLLTLFGPGGTGKTRVALQAAGSLMDEFERGIFFVPLASIQNPDLVESSIARTFKVQEVPGQTLLETLKDYFRDKQILLLLDNFERLLDAAPRLADLLLSCPKLKLLVTSQVLLRLAGEHEYLVLPLSAPGPGLAKSVEFLETFEAVTLFVQRAKRVKPDFVLTKETGPGVAQICYRLEGLPLALELAAARIRLFSPATLASKLSGRLKLLTGGARDLPSRQQSLRGTLDWSYDLLDQGEKDLFALLVVFVGGFTLSAAEAVCNPDGVLPIDVLDGLSSLSEKSFIRPGDGQDADMRFAMLETIREYGVEQLCASGQEAAVRRRHAEYFMEMAEEGESQLRGPAQGTWLSHFEVELDNFRTAMRWCADNRQFSVAVRIATALDRFWWTGYVREGQAWLGEFLARRDLPAAIRAKGLRCLGSMASFWPPDSGPTPAELLQQSLVLYRELNDSGGTTSALQALGEEASRRGDHGKAMELLNESLTLSEEMEDLWGTGHALLQIGVAAYALGDVEEAKRRFLEVLELSRGLGDQRRVAGMLNNLAWLDLVGGNLTSAIQRGEEALSSFRELGNKMGAATALDTLGYAALASDDFEWSKSLHREELALRQEMEDFAEIVRPLEGLACAAATGGEPLTAARLWGAVEVLRERNGIVSTEVETQIHESCLLKAHQNSEPTEFERVRLEGRRTPLEAIISCELSKAP